MFQEGQLKSLGVAVGLILLNIGVMWVFAFTPLSGVNDLLFGTFFFLGVIVYGAMLTGGQWIARKGIRSDDTGKAVIGTGIVQLAYGMFGAGILGFLSVSTQALALEITAAATSLIALVCGLLVFGTDHDFSNWDRYATYLFLGVMGISLIGSFSAPFILLAFVLAILGFIAYLIHQIYITKTRPGRAFLNGIGLYVAYMGVFVQILQIVVRMLIERE
ncbi:MAG: hypothetical protein ABEJ56_06370 [Candidatus Nanohaloarchaea archaeon]